jgi:hypothetical protein
MSRGIIRKGVLAAGQQECRHRGGHDRSGQASGQSHRCLFPFVELGQ